MISIISPCYNVETYLLRFVDSVLAQTYSDWELILIDDGSLDRTGRICDEYVEKDRRIHVIHQQNEGVSEARNRGLEISKGEYIVFWDADDWAEPDLLYKMHSACVRAGCEMAACDAYYIYQDKQGKMVKKADHKWGDLQEEKIVYGKEMYYSIFLRSATLWNKLFTARSINEIRFDKNKHYGEDTDFLFRVMQRMQSVILLPYIGYNYFYQHAGNVVSANIDKRSLELIDNAKQIYISMKELKLSALGVYRISVAVMEVIRKIPVQELGETNMQIYIRACGAAVRYPSFPDQLRFYLDEHFRPGDKARYLFNSISPGLRTFWKRIKFNLQNK